MAVYSFVQPPILQCIPSGSMLAVVYKYLYWEHAQNVRMLGRGDKPLIGSTHKFLETMLIYSHHTYAFATVVSAFSARHVCVEMNKSKVVSPVLML